MYLCCVSAVELLFCPGPPQQLVSSARDKKPRGRYARLEEEMERGNQDFIEQQRHQQQVRLKHPRIWISNVWWMLGCVQCWLLCVCACQMCADGLAMFSLGLAHQNLLIWIVVVCGLGKQATFLPVSIHCECQAIHYSVPLYTCGHIWIGSSLTCV